MERTPPVEDVTPTATEIVIRFDPHYCYLDHAAFVSWSINNPWENLIDYIRQMIVDGEIDEIDVHNIEVEGVGV